MNRPMLLTALACASLALTSCSAEESNAADKQPAAEPTSEVRDLLDDAADEIEGAAQDAADAIQATDADAELEKLKKELDSDG